MAKRNSRSPLEETLETKIDRRDFLKKAGMTVVASEGGPEIEWEMGTSLPLSLDTIYGGAVDFAERVSTLTGGRFRITPRAAGELVPGLEVLQNVQQDAIPAGHTASCYYVGLSPATAFS